MSSRREMNASGCSARSDSTLNSDSVRWTRSPSTCHLVAAEVELQAAELAHGPVPARAVELAPPQDRAHAAQELGARERLRHVVVGAELEAEHAVGLRVARGEHEDRDVALGPQRAADLDAGEPPGSITSRITRS